MLNFFKNLFAKEENETKFFRAENFIIPSESNAQKEPEKIIEYEESVESLDTLDITDYKKDDDDNSTILYAASLSFFQFSQGAFSKDISHNNSNKNATYGSSSLNPNGPIISTKVASKPKPQPKQEAPQLPAISTEDITQKKIDSTVSDQVN